jgi:hypothetical protein
MEANKIIGYVLLLIGVLMIIIPIWHTYGIFTGKALPAQVFMRPPSLTVNDKVNALDIQGQVQNALAKILPVDFINSTLNLATWLLLAWILVYGGGKVADIGIKLLKEVK